MGICLGDNDQDCLTNMRFADDVLLFAYSKEQLQKVLCDFKRGTEKWDSESIEERREFSATEAWTSDKKLRLVTSKSRY